LFRWGEIGAMITGALTVGPAGIAGKIGEAQFSTCIKLWGFSVANEVLGVVSRRQERL